MPQQYTGQGRYQVSCNDCGLALTTHGIPRGDSVVLDIEMGSTPRRRPLHLGAPLNDYFAWDRRGQRYYSICKQCKAARMAAIRRRWREHEATANAAPTAITPNAARRFGVELEVISPVSHAHLQQALRDEGLRDWRVKYDGSLSGGGAEVVSPVLSGDDGIEQIRRACRVLRRQGCSVNRSCGMHVHHEIRDMTVEQVKRLAHLWADNQDVIDGLVAPSRRGGQNTYCGRLSDRDLQNLDRVDRLERIASAPLTRYRTLNLASYGRYGTVEIRQHQGTLDAEKVTSWIALGQAMIEQSRCASAFQATRVGQFVTSLAHLDDTAGTYLLGRAVRFAAVAV